MIEQVDVQHFAQQQAVLRDSGGLRSTERSIPSPQITMPTLNLFEREDVEILVNEQQAWEDVEFEVALDSGSIVNVCHPDDCPGYHIGESAGSRAGQHFVLLAIQLTHRCGILGNRLDGRH